MRDMCGLVPAPSNQTSGPKAPMQPVFEWKVFVFRVGIATFSILETVMCYLAFLTTTDPRATFYNKFEAHVLQLPGYDVVLVCLAVINTVYLFLFWVVVAIYKLKIWRNLCAVRLIFSISSGLLCFVLVLYAEQVHIYPFLCTLCVLMHLGFVFLGFLHPMRRQVSAARLMICYTGISIVAMLTLAWVILYAVDGMVFFRNDKCLASSNRAMPVKIRGIADWQCVKWGQLHHIVHEPTPGEEPYQAHCSTTFHAFGRTPLPGGKAPERRAQLVRCPAQCQSLGLGTLVVGCDVYDARSAVCSAAVQMGLLQPNQGGVVKVVGREARASRYYGRCNRNTILSTESAPIQTNTSSTSNIRQEWAFYFQDAPGREADDMLTLHGWHKVEGEVPANEPWRRFSADVSWVLGGGTLKRREVQLGPLTGDDEVEPEIQLNFCHGDKPQPENVCP
mmetsp:Transcript_74853/g.148328  ORF Transcript_74853/g.148328 Transcript_74853/m.148328 type:complete len:448 (+) Transcript_74853:125-1468(+)